jgi:hypothetical protein
MVKFDRGDVIGELEWEWGVTYSVVLEVTFEMLDETEMYMMETLNASYIKCDLGIGHFFLCTRQNELLRIIKNDPHVYTLKL